MDVEKLLRILVIGETVWACVIFPVLFLIPAPYGRYQREGFGLSMPSRLAWIVMEFPTVVVPPIAFWYLGQRTAIAWALLGLWQLHYLQRTFVFPFLLRETGKRQAILTTAIAIVFNVVNGVSNGGYLGRTSAAFDVWFFLGAGIFLAGFVINIHSDWLLRNLRAPGETGYKIPRGGMFEYVTAANYFGELVEWVGFAIASRSPAAAAFALFTFANLAPRARTHHQWYLSKFPDYPQGRKAMLPFLF